MYIKRDKRPEKLPLSHQKSKNINIRVTPNEHDRIRRAANAQNLTITKWFERLIFGEDACK